MTPSSAITELQRMTPSELRKELEAKRMELAKMRLGLALQSEKNSASYKVVKKEVARMCMVLASLEKSGKSEKSDKSGTNNDEKMASNAEKNAVKSVGSEKAKAKKPMKKAKTS